MSRPLIFQNGIKELPSGSPLDVGPAATSRQALTPGQITAGANVNIVWENGLLTISAVGGGTGTTVSVADRLNLLAAAASTDEVLTVAGGGSGLSDAGIAIEPALVRTRRVPDFDGLIDVTAGADFDWIMTKGGDGANRSVFFSISPEDDAWAGWWITYGNWRGRWVYRHRTDAGKYCFFDPETNAWTFATWPDGGVFPGYPDDWTSRLTRVFAVAPPGDSEQPPTTGYSDNQEAPRDFTLDYSYIQLTGDEILVADSGNARLDGLWRAVPDARYQDRRYYRRDSDGGGIIYYYGAYNYGWILYGYGSYPGDGPPDQCSYIADDADPNHEYLAPASGGYKNYSGGNNAATTITVTG